MCQSPTGEDINKCKVLIHNEITVKTWGKQLFPFGTVYQRRKEKRIPKVVLRNYITLVIILCGNQHCLWCC